MDLHNLTSVFSQKTLATYQSQYNGEVKVIEQFGQRKIYAGGLLQSGSIIKQLWQKPLSQIKNKKIKTALILGFGGGTAAQLLSQIYPSSQITGIEIDPVMIEIYQEFFNPVEDNDCCPLKLINDDCFHWIKKCKHKYDLVLVDLYQGHDIPKQLYTRSFIHNLKLIMQENGILLINHLFFGSFQKRVPDLVQVLETEFKEIKLIRNLSNIFIFIKG